jgi:tetratricopeptide (TPR) repeat protein
MSISTRKYFFTILFLFGCLQFSALSVQAQNIRSIKGKITSENGEPIAGAAIKFQGQDIVREFGATSNKRGEYTYLLGNQGGIFRVMVHAKGFIPQCVENVRPEIGEAKEANFKLKVGEDTKLECEMSPAEKEELKKKNEDIEKRQKMSQAIVGNLKLANQLMADNKFDEAIVELNKAIDKVSEKASDLKKTSFLHNAVGEAYAKLGKNEEALQSFQKAISLEPDAKYYSNLGLAQNALGKSAESQESFMKSAEMDPANAGKNFYNIGVLLMNSGKMADSIDAFKKSIKADPNYAESYYQLGIALSGNPQTFSNAIENLKKYKEIGKNDVNKGVADDLIKALSGK